MMQNDLYSEEAEIALLSGSLQSKDNTYLLDIPVDAFYSTRNKLIFRVIRYLVDNNNPVELSSIINELKSHNLLKQAGEETYVFSLADAVSTSASWPYYKSVIMEKYNLRETHKKCQDVLKSIESGEITDNGTALDILDKHITNIYSKTIKQDFTPISDTLVDVFKQVEKNKENKNGIPGLDTGFIDFNRKTGGLQKSDLIILAARPSMGKTALAINIASNVAKQGNNVGIFSLEMSKVQIVNRLITGESNISNDKLKFGTLNDTEWSTLIKTNSKLAPYPIYIDDSTDITVNQMRAKCRNLAKKVGELSLIIIDYLQLVKGSGQQSREREIAEFSRGLKGLAKELNVPVLCLSQLNRKLEERSDKRPILSDLRESGAIEQDADIVSFIYREEVYNSSDDNENIAEIIFAKNRNGSIGFFKMIFEKEYTLFKNYIGDYDYNGR